MRYLCPDRLSIIQPSREFRQLLELSHAHPRPKFAQISTDSVLIENSYFYSEVTEEVPVLIYKPLAKSKNLPMFMCLYSTDGSKDGDSDVKRLLYQFAKLGFMAVNIDACFHGERIPVSGTYLDGITKAWRNKTVAQQNHPFFTTQFRNFGGCQTYFIGG